MRERSDPDARRGDPDALRDAESGHEPEHELKYEHESEHQHEPEHESEYEHDTDVRRLTHRLLPHAECAGEGLPADQEASERRQQGHAHLEVVEGFGHVQGRLR